MSLFNSNVKCFLCNTSLSLWNAHTCTRCGKKMCSHHSHLVRMPHSYVLSSVCVCCSDSTVGFPPAQFSSQQKEREIGTQPQALVGQHSR